MVQDEPTPNSPPIPPLSELPDGAAPAIELFRPLSALLAPPPPPSSRRASEPREFYINVFQDNRRGWMNSEAGFEDLSECLQSILDGQRGATYRYTVHIWREGQKRLSDVGHFEAEARAWAREGSDGEESFLYANSAGRRL